MEQRTLQERGRTERRLQLDLPGSVANQIHPGTLVRTRVRRKDVLVGRRDDAERVLEICAHRSEFAPRGRGEAAEWYRRCRGRPPRGGSRAAP